MSDVNSLSLPKPNIPEEGYNNCCASKSFNEDSEAHIPDEKVVVEPHSDSLKKRKWKWKFRSDTGEPGYVKEKIFETESVSIKKDTPYTITKREEVREENDLNVLGLNSLEASYKKKKWWEWRFGAKGGEHCGTLAADKNNFAYLDVAPQNKELPSENPDVDSNKESSEFSPSFPEGKI
ncbi:hypothetical protein WA026_019308 [Henosepilachna vigintioctopunctata]|uniref:SH3 domain-containing protein n=1 Tax=Henosepilachna vigintioctopunctata TaxID=420089 RepID=A0AAW1UAK6_9CUCU